jgi:hypothetical protein
LGRYDFLAMVNGFQTRQEYEECRETKDQAEAPALNYWAWSWPDDSLAS